MKKDNSKEELAPPKKRSLGGRILRGILWMAMLFLLLLGGLTLLFQMESFQNWAVKKLTEKLSKDLDTKVELKHIDFEIFDKLVLDSFYVEDLKGDTLLYSEKLIINFNSGLFSLYHNNLKVSDLTLQNATLQLNRKEGEQQTNMNQLLAKLFPPKEETIAGPPKMIYLSADVLFLENVTFENNDAVKGEDVNIFVKKGEIRINEIDLVGKEIIVESIKLDESYVQIDLKESHPLPVDNNTITKKEIEPKELTPYDSLYRPFQLLVHDFDFGNGKLDIHNYRKSPVKTTTPEDFDVNHLEWENINIAIDSFRMSDLNFWGNVKKISAIEKSGFVLENLSASDVKITSRRAELNGLQLKTPYSEVKDTIIFKYRDYASLKYFKEKVNMDLTLEGSDVAIRDLITFVPKLKSNPFFVNNANERIQVTGIIKGRVNKLRGENLKLVLGKRTIIEGDFNSRDLTQKGSEHLNLELKRLKTDVFTLRQLLPNFNPPSNFDKLGNINFNGRFDGFFVDFVAYGALETDLGRAEVDMRLDLKNGKKAAEYSGELNLLDFDLATWTGNDKLGYVTVTSQITDGRGLDAASAQAKIDANVESFTFKKYRYQDFKMDGQLTQNLFDGKFIIKDENIDLSFDGSVDFRDSIPVLDFKAKVNTLNFDELNLAKQDLAISGEMDLNIKYPNISDLTGSANFKNIIFQKNGNEKYTIDTLAFNSYFDAQGQKILSAQSEIFNGKIEGDFDTQEIPDAFILFLEHHHPEIAQRLGVKSKKQNLKTTQFDFEVNLIDSKNFTNLLDSKLDTVKNFSIKGGYDGIKHKVDLDLEVEELTYDKTKVGGIKWSSRAIEQYGSFKSLTPFYAIINGKNHIPEITIDGRLNRDTVVFEIGASGEKKTYDRFNIGGKVFFEDGGFNVSLTEDSLILFGEKWTISEDNFIQLGKRVLETKNFVLQNKGRTVSVKDLNQKGIHLRLENFNTGYIDSIWDYHQMDFAGHYSVDVKAHDIYNLKNFEGLVSTDTFWVNGDDWGKLELKTNMSDLKSELRANLTIQRGLRELSVDGFYVLPTTKKMTGKSRKGLFSKKIYAPKYFNFDVDFLNYPLNVVEYFIGKHASDTEGVIDINANISGFPKNIKTKGESKIYKGAITVNYLNTRYFFGQEEPVVVKITDDLFDFSGNIMKDKEGHIGHVEGGIVHTNYKDAGLDARIYADTMLILDTDKHDNSVYYGYGIGQVDVTFTGSFKQTDMIINATTGAGAKLFIPVTENQTTDEISFIHFRNEDANKNQKVEIKGIDVNMYVNVTEEAEVFLIFDEKAGDVIRGRGRGPLQLKVPRNEDIKLFGEYVIEEGDYLFTMYNFVNKKFKVKKGGTINWSGDPFEAQINLEANYDRLSTSVYNFIQEYTELGDDELKRQARKPTAVDLKMNLQGDLLKPDINFDISFPRLETGTVRNYVDTKLRILREDQSEMNRQVFGLIIVGGFLPSGQGTFAGADVTTSGINTVSEYLSHKVSSYLTDLVSEALSGVGFVKGIDFDVAYNVYGGGIDFDGNSIANSGREFQVNSSILLSDRFSINGGLDINTETEVGGTGNTGTFIGGDFVAEYVLTEDRRLKVRFYYRSEQDIENGTRGKTGVGLNYTRQFNTFKEFLEGMKKTARNN